ncbi:MAG: signal peptidase II [Erythrobacter sp. 34-65-8]|nr:MAG: signal peptidase II [Erythrobacter sp. 34-65-8]
MSVIWRNRVIGLLFAVALYVVDQLLKSHVVDTLGMKLGESREIVSFFNFTLTHNYGISLGMFQATSMEMRWILVAVTGLIALVVLVWMLREQVLGDILGLSLILGGALGNIHDRYNLGYVVDYADLHFGDFRPFLIFNVADAAITIGVVIILARSFLVREKAPNPDEQPAGKAAENGTHA